MIGTTCLAGVVLTLSPFFCLLSPCASYALHLALHVSFFAVAGLGFKYFATSSRVRLGHPLRNPFCIAFGGDDVVGLHNVWWAIFTALA